MVSWFLVDDQDDAASYVAKFADVGIEVLHKKPSEARPLLLREGVSPSGILMDVDLSGEAGNLGTGLGLAQDVRARQKSGDLDDCPIIRFANPGPVARNVRGDPTSDDLFDEFIYKSEVGRDVTAVATKLHLTESIYKAYLDIRLEENAKDDFSAVESILGLESDKIEDWVHPGLVTRLLSGLSSPVHVSAGVLLRACINAVGAMVDRPTLSMRLGLSSEVSGDQWSAIEKWLGPYYYKGIGSDYVDRWWATGLDQAWRSLKGQTQPLSAATISERVTTLSENLGIKLPPLTMPESSPGHRPWRWCQLSLEENEPAYVPVDPSHGVKMTMPVEQPAWVDPLMSSKGAALRKRDDPRFGPSERSKLR